MNIKFRAWNKVNKIMYADAINNCLDEFSMVIKHPQIYEVMQYIGLKDKNGVEVCEGDIIQAINRNYDCEDDRDKYFQAFKITYLNGCFMFGNWNAQEFYNKFMFKEIIGNIYENPKMI